MDIEKLIKDLRIACAGNQHNIMGVAATAITDLLARAEAAEARCASLDAIASEYQEEIIPGFRKLVEKAEDRVKKLSEALEREQRRAEKAERERDAAVQQIEIKLKEQMFANYINPYPPMMPMKGE